MSVSFFPHRSTLPLLRLRREGHGPAVVVSVAGELDMLTALALDDQVSIAETEIVPPAPVVLDLTEVSFIGAAGLTVFVDHHQRCAQRGSTLRLVTGGNRRVLRVLAITSLDTAFTLADTLDQGLRPEPGPITSAQPPRTVADQVPPPCPSPALAATAH